MASEKDVFTILVDHDTETDEDVSDLVNKKYCVQSSPADIKKLRKRLRSRKKSFKKKVSWKAVAESGSKKIEFESYSDIFRKPVLPDKTVVELHSQPEHDLIDHENGEPPAKVRAVENYKLFQDCGTRQKKTRTKDLTAAVNSFIDDECDGQLSPTQVLGYLLYKENCQSNKVC